MSIETAARGYELATRARARAVRTLATGRSSVAWLVEGPAGAWVARTPIEDSGRRITYRVESLIGRHLASRGHSVAVWTVVDVDGRPCSLAPHLEGAPAQYHGVWTSEFGRAMAGLFVDLHHLPVRDFGPLVDDEIELRGVSSCRVSGVVDRWSHAPIWPIDESSLTEHPVRRQAPEVYDHIAPLGGQIKAAQAGAVGVVHSDLHREHLLLNDEGSLAGVLDFGVAFVGAVAWDFASLNWYYGRHNATLVAAHYPNGGDELRRGRELSIAVGLYKLAKNPAHAAVLSRLRRCVADLTQTI